MSNEHAVYRLKDGDRAYLYYAPDIYLFYWTPYKDWVIGADYTKYSGWVASVDDQESTCPNDATTWKYSNNTHFVDGNIMISSGPLGLNRIFFCFVSIAILFIS